MSLRTVALATLILAWGCAWRAYDPVAMDPRRFDADFPAALTETRIESGGAGMNAIVYRAAGAGPHPTAVLLHGFPGNERNLDLAQALRRSGWNVVFFHYRGAWGSEGAFSFANVLEDVAAAVRFVRSEGFVAEQRGDAGRIALVGHSMGGFAALAAGSELSEVGCLVSIAGANLGLVGRSAREGPERRAALAHQLDAWSQPLRGAAGAALVEELAESAERFDLLLRADALAPRALLLVAGARDRVTPAELHHAPLVQALEARGAARLSHAILASDHAFSDRRIALARLVTSWLATSCR